MVAQACSALPHSSAKWWELQAQHWAEHCTVLHLPSFYCTSCHHACLFLFQFGWKFPPEMVLVIFYQKSHNSCFSFGFQGTPFSCSFLCPRFQTSPFSLFSAVCTLPVFRLCPSLPVCPLPSGSIAVEQRGLEAQRSSAALTLYLRSCTGWHLGRRSVRVACSDDSSSSYSSCSCNSSS